MAALAWQETPGSELHSIGRPCNSRLRLRPSLPGKDSATCTVSSLVVGASRGRPFCGGSLWAFQVRLASTLFYISDLLNCYLGRGLQENATAIGESREYWDAYWDSKRVDFSKIKIPSYVLASYSSMLHTMGSVRAFKEINCDKKWLRFHPHQEWYEDYLHSSVDDLDRFFERYLKGKSNGWEATPKVRVSMYRYGETVRITYHPSSRLPFRFR